MLWENVSWRRSIIKKFAVMGILWGKFSNKTDYILWAGNFNEQSCQQYLRQEDYDVLA